MNKNIQKLTEISGKDERLIIGLMSGTSLDGLDIALCRFSGSGLKTSFKLVEFVTVPYGQKFKDQVLEVFARKDNASLEKVCLLNAFIGDLHAEMILSALSAWEISPAKVDVIASHGQTIYHAPKHQHHQDDFGNATLQIGDGDHIAVKTGIITISDFRQKHIAAGGEGAPLALYGDVILGSQPGENRILLNIGGIANLTYLPGDDDLTEVMCTDIGPGNTLIDAACRKYYNKPYDQDSQIAYSGTVNETLLTQLLAHPFYNEPLPKTTGPELFNLAYVSNAQEMTGLNNLAAEDIVATLSALTAHVIARFTRQHFQIQSLRILTSGGGASNPFVINKIRELLPEAEIGTTADIGINADAKEAILFALLANEALCGEPIAIGTNPAVLMGKISFPV